MEKTNFTIVIKIFANELAFLLLILVIPTALVVIPIMVSQQKAVTTTDQAGERKDEKNEEHPGKIQIVDRGDKTKKEFDAAFFPNAAKFVYLKGGAPVRSPEDADVVIPVTEMEIIPQNDLGTVVPLEESTRVIIHYFGPQRKLLRSANFNDKF